MTFSDLRPDVSSPVPLYHQISESLRYRIATGAIPIGSILPTLREGARLWGVNLHTVRRAYAQLAEAGIVLTRAPLGTRVLPEAGRPLRASETTTTRAAGRSRDAFIERVIGEARERHGLAVQGLIALLEDRGTARSSAAGITVHVAECSLSQSEDLARQIESRWRVRAVAWPIDRDEPPPPSPVIATYFHYNDLRLRWPDRFPDIHFVAISPDPSLPARLHPAGAAHAAGGGSARGRRDAGRAGTVKYARVPVFLCERDASMLSNIAADVSRLLPAARFHVRPRLVRRPTDLLAGLRGADVALVAPRVWGDLPEATRQDPRVHQLRYVFDPRGLDAVARDLRWAIRTEE